MPRTFRNPVLPGFHPDPSICRVGDDYYLVTSSFEYFPGLPLFHSRDLVNWRQIGHVLDRPEQLPLDGVRPSGGLYAPTLRHHNGTFYVINTLVDGHAERGNFIVSASDPTGPWSQPRWLPNTPGIDPSLLFDDDGRVWMMGNRPAANRQYKGHAEIWLQELDLERLELIGEPCVLWDGALKGAIWAEGPHLYKIDGYYYLMIAEGGTEHNHAVTIARSAQVAGPYEPNPRNPILTHRHLGQGHPIVGTGHADLVQTPAGDWWMVLLAMRPYDGYFYNLGRETFLAPVVWQDGWPVVCPGSGQVEQQIVAPNLPEQRWPSLPACDNFEAAKLAPQWNMLRTPREQFWSLQARPGYLRLQLRPQRIAEWACPSWVGRRQQHHDFAARAALEFTPASPHECAGLALLQNSAFYLALLVTRRDSRTLVQLLQQAHGSETLLAELPVDAQRLYLKVEAYGQRYSFYVAEAPEQWRALAEDVDGRILSTPVAGGFVGAFIGMYASSNGQPSANSADFDWFEYLPL